ncbi:CRISPR-associated endoribonuclease Cas6 [Paenibacillus sediminis]|uniref:CRISPR-associated endoribonuclease Cas6 n=1 Tax=Paenibacillus sediminis TaxID=664909 RepID=A0ABS4H5K4_9BACL|nr:CRISPR-associated endoribonuclease Cas6 [Paenibacillus sediminis]MBP1937537.1 CRISPR-associated endoribonuclease Cas6 [Paenibacillus sediminis]
MRLSVSYRVNRLPLGYRMVVLSLIKEALRRSNEQYYKQLYEVNRHSMKPFSTATYLRDFTYLEDEIHLKELTITIGSHDMEFMLNLFNGLQQLHTYTTAGETWKRVSMKMLKEATITSNTVYFSTLSPILIESQEGKPVHPEDASYEKEFNYYASLRIRELTGRDPFQTIQVKPISYQKTVVKEQNSVFLQQTASQKNSYLYFTAYRGTFKLIGHPEDLQILYYSGIGKRVSQGYGLLEYEREEGTLT